jgi:hypothetical protein
MEVAKSIPFVLAVVILENDYPRINVGGQPYNRPCNKQTPNKGKVKWQVSL